MTSSLVTWYYMELWFSAVLCIKDLFLAPPLKINIVLILLAEEFATLCLQCSINSSLTKTPILSNRESFTQEQQWGAIISEAVNTRHQIFRG